MAGRIATIAAEVADKTADVLDACPGRLALVAGTVSYVGTYAVAAAAALPKAALARRVARALRGPPSARPEPDAAHAAPQAPVQRSDDGATERAADKQRGRPQFDAARLRAELGVDEWIPPYVREFDEWVASSPMPSVWLVKRTFPCTVWAVTVNLEGGRILHRCGSRIEAVEWAEERGLHNIIDAERKEPNEVAERAADKLRGRPQFNATRLAMELQVASWSELRRRKFDAWSNLPAGHPVKIVHTRVGMLGRVNDRWVVMAPDERGVPLHGCASHEDALIWSRARGLLVLPVVIEVQPS